jgi:predicted HicB family RNase H-like nuclease
MPIDDILHRHAKIVAVTRGISLKALVEAALIAYIGEPPAALMEAVKTEEVA